MSRTARLRKPLRKTAKWGGLVATLLLCMVWLGSCWWSLYWKTQCGSTLQLAEGTIGLWWRKAHLLANSPPRVRLDDLGLRTSFSPPGIGLWDWDLELGSNGTYGASFPLWLPLLLTGTISALAWRADLIARRRARIGKCIACGYPLDGLPPDSPCPECGKPSPAP